MIDLLVAGGGPAGLAAAIFARLAGMTVTVVEPRRAPIDKACGEGIMPSGVKALRALGCDLDRAGTPIRGVRYADARDPALGAQGSFRAPGLGLRRTALHQALWARAEELGVSFRRGRIDAVEQARESVRAAGLCAGHLLAADGLHSRIRRSLGLSLPPRLPRRYGVRRHFRIAPWSDCVEVHLGAGVEAYVTPVGADSVGVAFLGGPPLSFAAELARFPLLGARLAGALPLTLPLGAGPFEQRVRCRVRGRVMLAGDAAGYLDPLTGEGVALGIATARAAVAMLAAGDLLGYERRYRVLTARHVGVTRALLAIVARRRLQRPLLALLECAPGLLSAAMAACEADRDGDSAQTTWRVFRSAGRG